MHNGWFICLYLSRDTIFDNSILWDDVISDNHSIIWNTMMIWFLVLNATFSNISAISWRPVYDIQLYSNDHNIAYCISFGNFIALGEMHNGWFICLYLSRKAFTLHLMWYEGEGNSNACLNIVREYQTMIVCYRQSVIISLHIEVSERILTTNDGLRVITIGHVTRCANCAKRSS
jgi:hypothetical protein